MAGPTLQLNITAPGQKSVEASVSAVERLAAALKSLPAASAELAKLQKQLAGVQQGPAGMAKGSGDLKELVGEIKNLGAQLSTAFGSLEATIKAGWGKAAAAQEAGAAAGAAKSKPKGLTFASVGTAGQPIEVAAGWFAKMQTGSLKIQDGLASTAAKEAAAIAKAADKVEAGIQAADAKLQASFMKRFENEAKWLQGVKLTSAKWTTAWQEKQDKEAAAAAKAADKIEAGIQAADAKLQASFMKRYEDEAKWLQGIKITSAKWEEAWKEKQAREAAAADKWRVGLQTTSAQWAEAYRESQAKLEAASDKWLQGVKVKSAQMAETAREAAEREALAIQAAAARVAEATALADARYAAMNERGQARTVLAARSRLDRGISPSQVEAGLGSSALSAAQGTTFAQAYTAAYPPVKKVHDEIAAGKPKIEGYNKALGDMHSGLRGVASGFGQMALTWGAIGPLLAGAALSHSFVQTIKQGAQVRQDLEALRVLSEESAGAVKNLEDQMSSLARTGPFGPREIAEAMKTLSLAGLNATEVGKALSTTLAFAITGGVSIQKSAESLVAIGTAYGYQADQFSTVADAVSKAAAVSMSSVEGMMESFRASSIVAQAYGVSLKDAATAQALLANIGIRGSAAGTAMRQMYSELSGATASTRAAMQRLNVEVVDQQGKMKPLITIMTDLSKALSGLSGPARIAAIQALSNERGSKSIVAALTAVESKAHDVGSTASNELERIRQLIETSAGFNAIAASQLSTTPLNLMKGVAASFQDALMDAFKALEPVLTVTAARIREVFNSQEFREGITWLVTAMGTLTSAFVENLSTLKYMAYAYAAFKGFQYLQLGMSGLAVAMGLINKELVFTSTGIVAAGSAAARAAPALTGMAAAASGLGLVLRFLGPIGLALGLATAAWEVYSQSQKNTNAAADANAIRQDLTLKNLKEETKRLEDLNGEMAKGTKARLAEIRAKELEAVASRNLEDEKTRSPLRDAAASTKSLYEDAVASGASPNVRAIRKADADAAQARLTKFNIGTAERENAISFQQQVVKSEQNHYNMLKELEDAANAPMRGKGTWDSAGKLAAAANHDASELALLKKNFDTQEKEAQVAYRRQMELLELAHKGKLISEGEYTYQAEQFSEQLYGTEMRNLAAYVNESQSLIARLKANPKKDVKAQGYIDEIATAQREAQSQYEHQQKLAAAREASRGGQLSAKVKEDMDKLRESIDLQEQKYDADLRGLGLSPALVAAEQAMASARATGTAALRPLVDELTRAQIALNRLNAEEQIGPDYGGVEQQDRIRQLEAYVGRLKSQLAAGGVGVEGQAQRAGGVAKSAAELSAEGWRKYVEQGQNAYTVLEASRNSFMQGWIDSGRSIWETWLTTGKVSILSLRQLFMKTLADITYQMMMVKPFAQAGANGFDGIFGTIIKAIGGYGANSSTAPIPAGEMVNAGGWAKGGAFSGGMEMFAKGAVFNSPHLFQFGKGGRNLGMMGEQSPGEAIMPLARGAGGDLGVRVHGGTQRSAGTSIVIENYGSGEEPQVSRESKPDGSEMIRIVLNATAKDISRGGVVRKSMQSSTKTTPNLPRY